MEKALILLRKCRQPGEEIAIKLFLIYHDELSL